MLISIIFTIYATQMQ